MGEQKEEKKITSSVWNTTKPFVNGGASGMLATCVIQPIDMVKVPSFYNPYFVVLILLHYSKWMWQKEYLSNNN